MRTGIRHFINESEPDTESKINFGAMACFIQRTYNFTEEARISERIEGKFSPGLGMGIGVRKSLGLWKRKYCLHKSVNGDFYNLYFIEIVNDI